MKRTVCGFESRLPHHFGVVAQSVEHVKTSLTPLSLSFFFLDAMKNTFNKRDFKARKKDWRKPHRRPKSIDGTCRNHGSCSWCEGNRLHSRRRAKRVADDQLET